MKLRVIWSCLSIVVMIGLFASSGSLTEVLVETFDLKIAEEQVVTNESFRVQKESYEVIVYKPIISDFIYKRGKGFVHVEFHFSGDNHLVSDSIDYNRDGIVDFNIEIDSDGNIHFATLSDNTIYLLKKDYIYTWYRPAANNSSEGLYHFEDHYTVRVAVRDI